MKGIEDVKGRKLQIERKSQITEKWKNEERESENEIKGEGAKGGN